ncbi:MAG: DUF3781 domain-containing protein [Ruminococcus sp.]|nr:DUF3781 domain-containing protein [Ruminococcus sp.]
MNLLGNTEKLHTTELGEIRIKRNLSLGDVDAVEWCRKIITDKASHIERRGKNYYVRNGKTEITVNAHSYTIITAHIK